MTLVLMLTNISHRYDQDLVLNGVTLVLEPGVTALIGVNGAGKTSLLSIASGALRPTHGQVSVRGHDLYTASGRRNVLPRISLMPQRFAFIANFRVEEFVSYLGFLRGMPWNAAAKSTAQALEAVGLSNKAKEKMSALSGGMVRRAGLAQALVASPDVLLLDEPTTGLDPEQRVIIRDLIGGLADNRVVLLSSHIMEDVETLADRVIVIHEGAVLFDGTMSTLKGTQLPGEEKPTAEQIFLSLIYSSRTR